MTGPCGIIATMPIDTAAAGSTALLERPTTDLQPSHGDNVHTHIVVPRGRDKDKVTASALVTEARIFGTVVEALCGYRWTPQHDSRSKPLCEKCKAIWEQKHGPNSIDGHVPHA